MAKPEVATTRTGQALRLQQARQRVAAIEEVDVRAAIIAASGGKGRRVVFGPVGDRTALKLAAGMAQSGILFSTAA